MQEAILLVEDVDADAQLIRRALEKSATVLSHAAETWDEPIDYLTGAAPYQDRSLNPFPDLVLLDPKPPVLGSAGMDAPAGSCPCASPGGNADLGRTHGGCQRSLSL